MNSRQFDKNEHSIPRLLFFILTLLIEKIVLNCEIESEILILVALSYCSVSNIVSQRPLFY